MRVAERGRRTEGLKNTATRYDSLLIAHEIQRDATATAALLAATRRARQTRASRPPNWPRSAWATQARNAPNRTTLFFSLARSSSLTISLELQKALSPLSPAPAARLDSNPFSFFRDPP